MQVFLTIGEMNSKEALNASKEALNVAGERYYRLEKLGYSNTHLCAQAAEEELFLKAAVAKRREKWLAAHNAALPRRDATEARLGAINRKAELHIVNVTRLVRLADDSEGRLAAAGIPKRERVGARVRFTPSVPGYMWHSVSTTVEIVRGATGWKLVEALRVERKGRYSEELEIRITSPQAKTVRAKAMAGLVECADGFEKHGINHLSASSLNLWANAHD